MEGVSREGGRESWLAPWRPAATEEMSAFFETWFYSVHVISAFVMRIRPHSALTAVSRQEMWCDFGHLGCGCDNEGRHNSRSEGVGRLVSRNAGGTEEVPWRRGFSALMSEDWQSSGPANSGALHANATTKSEICADLPASPDFPPPESPDKSTCKVRLGTAGGTYRDEIVGDDSKIVGDISKGYVGVGIIFLQVTM